MTLYDVIKKPHINLIGDFNYTMLKGFLKSVNDTDWKKVREAGELTVIVNSVGGDVSVLLPIAETLLKLKRKYKFKLNTYATGEAMSAGFYIFIMGEERKATPYTEFLHHEIRQFSYSSCTIKDAELAKTSMIRLQRFINRYCPFKLTKEEKKIFNNGDDLMWSCSQAKKRGIVT